MDDVRLKGIVEALAGSNVLSYELKEGGVLVLIDQAGRKRRYLPEDYQHLLRKAHKTAKLIEGGTNEQSQ